MLKHILKPMLVAGLALTGAACVEDGTAAPRGYYQQQPGQAYQQQQAPGAYYNAPYNNQGYNNAAYNNPYYNNGYNAQQQQNQAAYNQGYRPGYTTVNVTNRGQNGNRDEVVQQQVACSSQYYDGYRNRTAPRC